MRGIDTNVLLRYLVEEDDKKQAAPVEEFLSSCEAARENVYVSCIVLCEMAWVLRRVFGLAKTEILDHIERLLDIDSFDVEEAEVVQMAVRLSREGPGDFADHLLGQLNLDRGCHTTVTFDRAMRSNPAFSVL